ncbi:MAG: DUF433 domain-containing protein [Planctomycetaceae bacterium]
MLPAAGSTRIEITPGVCGGRPRIAGHRITVQNIAIWHERLGQSAEEIAADYELELADVYAALAYYFDHKDQIDELICEDEEFVASLREGTVSPLQEKLRKMRHNGASDPTAL